MNSPAPRLHARHRLRQAEAVLSTLAAEITDPLTLTPEQQRTWDAAWAQRQEALADITEPPRRWTTAA
ncbi:hypothetical protein [Actinomadura gamaensis]|uniref:Uncharacterized protein n=1 Tax=Actinomadura gamaensis TaxID=1763541 RepID=A0ABV9U2Y6_9ACTN